MAINKRLIKSNDEAAAGPSFNTVTYTGTGLNQQVTGVGFEPDFVWIKSRTTTNPHVLHDTVRGIGNVLYSNLTNAEADESLYFTGVGDGFLQFGINAGNYNNTGTNYVAWCWKAGGAAVTNTDGTITSQVSANTEAGFSIVSYTGNGASSATVGHGLGAAPSIYIVKRRDSTSNWAVFTGTIIPPTGTPQKYLFLDSTQQANGASQSLPTSSVIEVLPSFDNINSATYIAYCFAEVEGFSKFGSYTGTSGSVTVTGLGFEPAFVMIKGYSVGASYGGSWLVVDNKRGDGGLGTAKFLGPDTNGTEFTNAVYGLTFTSDGFEIPAGSSVNLNTNGGGFIYMAFANQF